MVLPAAHLQLHSPLEMPLFIDHEGPPRISAMMLGQFFYEVSEDILSNSAQLSSLDFVMQDIPVR